LILVWISKATPIITIQERRYAKRKGRREGGRKEVRKGGREKGGSGTSVTGVAHLRFVDLSGVHESTLCMSPTLNRSSALQHFQHDNAVEIRNRIMFDFYPGLSQLPLTTHSHV